jgi:hypothetical protein
VQNKEHLEENVLGRVKNRPRSAETEICDPQQAEESVQGVQGAVFLYAWW